MLGDQGFLRHPRSTAGRMVVEKWVQDMVRPLEGTVEPERYGDYILPLLVLKRISDVSEDEALHGTVRYHIPKGRDWRAIRERRGGLGAFINETAEEIVWASEENFRLIDVIDRTDYSALDDEILEELVKVLSRYRLGLKDVHPDLFGIVHRHLGRLAGETPLEEMDWLLCGLASPQPGDRIISTPTGYGGLLPSCYQELLWLYGEVEGGVRRPTYRILQTQFVAVEPIVRGFVRAMANGVFHGMETQLTVEPSLPESKWFDVVVAYEGPNTGWARAEELKGRLWEDGRMAIVLHTGAGHSRDDWEIRKHFVDADLVEAVISTPAGLVVGVNRAKRRSGEVLLVEAPENLTRIGQGQLLGLVRRWDEEDGRAAIVGTEVIARNGYDLRPSRYLA